jgi:hypothetical protein
LTDKNGIPLSVVISPASTHDIKLVTDVVDNTVIKRPKSSSKSKSTLRRRNAKSRKLQNLCLDKVYNSAEEEQELIKRGNVLLIPYKKKRGKDNEEKIKAIPNVKNILLKDRLQKELFMA